MKREALQLLISPFVDTLVADLVVVPDHWGTHKKSLEDFLQGFLAYTTPNPLERNIKRVEAELAALLAKQAESAHAEP